MTLSHMLGKRVRHLKYGDGKVESRPWTNLGAVHEADRHLYGPAIVVRYHGGYEHFLQFHNGQVNEYHLKEIVQI